MKVGRLHEEIAAESYGTKAECPNCADISSQNDTSEASIFYPERYQRSFHFLSRIVTTEASVSAQNGTNEASFSAQNGANEAAGRCCDVIIFCGSVFISDVPNGRMMLP